MSAEIREEHREWARQLLSLAPREEAEALARDLAHHLGVEPSESVSAALSSLRDAVLEELHQERGDQRE